MAHSTIVLRLGSIVIYFKFVLLFSQAILRGLPCKSCMLPPNLEILSDREKFLVGPQADHPPFKKRGWSTCGRTLPQSYLQL